MNLSSLATPIKSYLSFEVSNFSNCPKEKDLDLQSIAHGVDLIYPDELHITNEIINCFGVSSEYYKVVNLPLSCLVDKQFIEAFVKRGNFYLMSVGTKIDLDNCVVLLPPGNLILNIDKNTYEELGLQGQPSRFNGKRPNKYVITINLTEDSFTPGKRNYDRVLQRLSSLQHLCFNCILAWKPLDDCVCPSSVAAYFHKHLHLAIDTCNILRKSHVLSSFEVPVINAELFKGSDNSANYEDVHDWIGVVCNMDSDSGKNFIQEFLVSMPTLSEKEIRCDSGRGFFTCQQIKFLIERLRDLMKDNKLVPWVCVVIHGFEDCPVSFGLNEHGFLFNGDNALSLVLFNDGYYWKYKALGSYDIL